MNASAADWYSANQTYLAASLAAVRGALERYAAGRREGRSGDESQDGDAAAAVALREAARAMVVPPALETLCAAFRLSDFERDVLVLCAGVELDAEMATLCAKAQGDAARTYPTWGLALAALDGAHWSALTPAAPLRYWRLLEVGAGGTLTLSPLRIEERVLHYLNGVSHTDERLDALIEPVRVSAEMLPSQRAAAERMAALFSQSRTSGPALPVVQLCGDAPSARAVAVAACDSLGLNLCALPAEMLPADATELDALLRLWGREAALGGSALLIECDPWEATETMRTQALARFVERCAATPLVVSARERRRLGARPSVTIELERPGSDERRTVWRAVVGAEAQSLNGRIEALSSQFHLSAEAIRAAGAEAMACAAGDELGEALWDACRAQARPRLDSLAQRLDPALGWDDLVLPDAQRTTLREIAAHVRRRSIVYETWGFGARGARGLGVSALFAGVSGTGKTMAAEVIARELRLDLYRIDLSQVVSKYIGETEKNLRRVFDAAEEGGAILLFDEADALFGRRSEVKDSHDRYANIEVSYLLQRVEAYRGLAILTTNMKSAVDSAFLRRIRFHVEFPFPAAEQRAEIWRRIFPPAAPTEGLDVYKLASLHVTGGNIHNIALGAAFLAADGGGPVRMSHVLSAARSEYAKLERSLTEAEVADWV